MENIQRYVRYILIAVIVASILALGWWYVFLKNRATQMQQVSTGRGFGTEIPVGSALGSAYQNIVSSVTDVLLGSSASTSEKSLPRLRQVSPTPAAGIGFVGTASSTELYFIERGTGYVLAANLTTGEVSRRSNTLRTKTYEALVGATGGIIERGIDEKGHIVTFMGTIVPKDDAGTLSGVDLEPNISALAWSPDGASVVYAVPASSGTIFKTVTASSTAMIIHESGVRDWRLAWPKEIIIAQHPTRGLPSTAYSFTLEKKALSLLVEGPGVSALGQSTAALIMSTVGADVALSMRATADAGFITIPLKTVAEKCAWVDGTPIAYCAVPKNLDADFPDSWYRGEYHTEDAFWMLDASSGTWTAIPRTLGDTSLDARSLVIDDGGTHLAFINARDNSVWVLRLTND